jgi:hypothetical protein
MPRDTSPQPASDAGIGAGGGALEQLAARVAANPAAPEFAELAEMYRLTGRLDEAQRVAEAGLAAAPESAAGRVVLALTLLDLGQVDEARQQLGTGLRSLQSAAAPQPPEVPARGVATEGAASGSSLPALEDVEIERAFETAEAQPDEMIDANKVVQAALRREELDRPEVDLAPLPPSFATRTMADLLESQGDVAGAERIRSSLDEDAEQLELDAARVPGPAEPEVDPAELRGGVQRSAIIATLETWLENLRRGVA